MYEIAYEAAQRVVRMRMAGFWSPDTAIRFSSEVLTLCERVARRDGRYAVLLDGTAFDVQTPEVAGRLAALTRAGVALSDAPYAMAVGSMLAKLQAQRLLNVPNARVFLAAEEAEAWLRCAWIDRLAA